MSYSDKLRELRAAKKAELDAIAERGENISADEVRASFALVDDIKELDARIVDADAMAEREAVIAEAHAGEATEERGAAVVVREERTYTPDAERREGRSFIQDVYASKFLSDPNAQQRLARHMNEEIVERGSDINRRDIGTSAVAALTVPQYLVDLAAPLARAMRPTADIATKHPLPAEGTSIVISRVTTGTGAAVQATENSAVQETNLDDTTLTVNVRTIAGQQDVSRQIVERSAPGTTDLVVQDLIRAYHSTLDSGILNDDGTSGTHLGIRSTSSIVAVTYTDASPTAAEAYPKLFDLISQVQSGVYQGVSHFVMHPRRWNWLAASVGTSFPFLQVAGLFQQAGSVDTHTYGGVVGNIAGVPVIVDGNLPTNLGTGTNEDVILGVTASELHLWEDGGAPMFIRAEDVGSGSLSVKFVVYGYSAFTAGRYPGAHGTIGGTGLVTPTF